MLIHCSFERLLARCGFVFTTEMFEAVLRRVGVESTNQAISRSAFFSSSFLLPFDVHSSKDASQDLKETARAPRNAALKSEQQQLVKNDIF